MNPQKSASHKSSVKAYEDILAGEEYSFERVLTFEDGLAFAKLSGDHNPLHCDELFGKAGLFGRNVVHGMMLGSLFSALVGMYCPGQNSLYVSQSLEFRMPVFYGDTVKVKGTVLEKSDALQMITIKTEIFKDGHLAVSGQARVKMVRHE